MDLAVLLNTLGESASLEAVAPYWNESCASFRWDTFTSLNMEFLREWRSWCGFGPELDGDLAIGAGKIDAHEGLPLLLYHLQRRLSSYPDGAVFDAWPLFQKSLGDEAGLFYLIAALSIVPAVREAHRYLGVSEDVTRETLRQIACFCGNYQRDFDGRAGILRNQFAWLALYVKGHLFRLGRLEYKLDRNPEGLSVFRRRRDGAVTALLRGGLVLRADGFIAGEAAADPKGTAGTAPVAVTTLTAGSDFVEGYPITEAGRASLEPMRLNQSEWEMVLRPEDVVLDMHIPAGGNMDIAACVDSFHRAFAFFPDHFPGVKPRAILCSSWIFNPALQVILREDSNLVLMQRIVHLFPVPSDPEDGLFFIYGTETDFSKMPRRTSLQRAVWDYIQGGNEWRGGGMYLLKDELPEAFLPYY